MASIATTKSRVGLIATEAKIVPEARPDDAYAYMQHMDPITGAQPCVMRPR